MRDQWTVDRVTAMVDGLARAGPPHGAYQGALDNFRGVLTDALSTGCQAWSVAELGNLLGALALACPQPGAVAALFLVGRALGVGFPVPARLTVTVDQVAAPLPVGVLVDQGVINARTT